MSQAAVVCFLAHHQQDEVLGNVSAPATYLTLLSKGSRATENHGLVEIACTPLTLMDSETLPIARVNFEMSMPQHRHAVNDGQLTATLQLDPGYSIPA